MNKKTEDIVNRGFPISEEAVRHLDPFTWETAKNGTRFAIMIPCSDCGKPIQWVGWREEDEMPEPKVVCVDCFMKDDPPVQKPAGAPKPGSTILHEAYDLIKPLYDPHDPPTTYRDRVGCVLAELRAVLEGTDRAIGKPLPAGEWCICGPDPEPLMPPPGLGSSGSISADLAKVTAYKRQQKAVGQCEIGAYVPTIHCTAPATTLFGIGSIIKVCDEHAKWNPSMLKGGICPDCGKLADHDPCPAARLESFENI